MKDSNWKTPTTALHELFMNMLRDLLWAEEQLYEVLYKIEFSATSSFLKEIISDQSKDTAQHIQKIRLVFDTISERPTSMKCEAMAGLIDEIEDLLESTPNHTMIRDVAIIVGMQKVKRYEIATYNTLISFARVMKHSRAQALLESIVEKEEIIDTKLAELSESIIIEAANEEQA